MNGGKTNGVMLMIQKAKHIFVVNYEDFSGLKLFEPFDIVCCLRKLLFACLFSG